MPKRALTAMLAVAVLAGAAFAAVNIGQAGSPFKLPGTDGKDHDFAALKGETKAVLLLWISKNCPVSLGYDDYYNRLFEQFEGKDVTVLAINSNQNESMAEIAEHAKAKGFRFAVLRDAGAKVADAYGATKTPEVRVFNGDLVLKYKGAITNNQNPSRATVHHAANAVNAVLAGRDPDPADVVAFGCGIKR